MRRHNNNHLHLKLSSNMDVVIYQSLIIYIVVLFYGVHTFSVVIGGSKLGLIGSNGTEIECSYTTGTYIQFSLSFWAVNKNSKVLEQIATYIPDQTPLLNTNGQYLKGRVTLTPITKSSSKAVMTFNKLMCIDGTSYKCKVIYTISNGTFFPVSNNISISVQVPPSKPDSVSLVHTPADSSVTTTKHMDYISSSPYTAVTSKENETASASQTEKQTTTTAFNLSTIDTTTGHNSTTSPISNISYRTTTYSLQQTTTAQGIAEGDNITVVCTGDVGKPPAKHVFQKYLNEQMVPMQETVTITSISEMSENCSYYRISNLTFQVTAADNNAVIRCVVNSSMEEPDMYVETAPIEVYYEVSMPTIIKYPNKTYYVVGVDTSILLTCKSDGNPKPYYQWYKENDNDLISTNESWTITDINVTNSGVYTCNISNTFNGDTYRNAKNVLIDIMNKADISTTQSTSTGSSSGAYDKTEQSTQSLGPVIGGVAGAAVLVIVMIIVIVYIRKKITSEKPTIEKEPKSLVSFTSKPIAESKKAYYVEIALEEDTNKRPTVNNGHELEDIREHNKEYLKKQKEEEQKMNESNTSPQPAVYAQVNEATKSKNKQNTETLEFVDQQEDGTYAESQEGIYDKSGDRRHKLNENDEHYDTSTNLSTQNSNGDTKSFKQKSQVGSYNNHAFEKDDNRKVATVSPTIRSSGGLQDDEQTNQNRQSQSKKEYENVMGKDQTDTSEGDSSHRTAL